MYQTVSEHWVYEFHPVYPCFSVDFHELRLQRYNSSSMTSEELVKEVSRCVSAVGKYQRKSVLPMLARIAKPGDEGQLCENFIEGFSDYCSAEILAILWEISQTGDEGAYKLEAVMRVFKVDEQEKECVKAMKKICRGH
jgi:predicted rRNA methylase YqxC with S4 and FtsJ domains